MEDSPEEELDRVPFWFLRHGETEWNAQGLSQGSVDIPLNPTGLAQASSAANLLRNRGIATIVSSPLIRARTTAEIVANALDLPLSIDGGLREVAFGAQEGQKMSAWFPEWIAGNWTPPGAETFAGLRRRVVAAVNRCTALPAPVLIVGHGASFRALRSAMQLEPNTRTRNAVPIWCEPGLTGGPWTLQPMLEGALQF
jgi:broad specificity phosphatase PhoE